MLKKTITSDILGCVWVCVWEKQKTRLVTFTMSAKITKHRLKSTLPLASAAELRKVDN